MADPVKLLREHVLSDRSWKEVKYGGETYVAFGDIAFSKSVKTNLKIYGKENQYYALESLLLLWEKKDMAHTAYVKEAARQDIQAVTRPDRRDLLDYLKGERDMPPSYADVAAPVPVPVQIARLTSDQHEGPDVKRARLDQQDHHHNQSNAGSNVSQMHRDNQQRIESLLSDQPGDRSTALRDLSDQLTAEKIAELKGKHKAHKRTLIQPTDDNLAGVRGDVGDIGMDGELVDREVRNKERVWLTRVSCLCAPAKKFQQPVFAILQSLKAREDSTSGQKHDMDSGSSRSTQDVSKSQRSTVPTPGYSRYDQERFRKDDTAGFGIDTGLTFRGADLKAITETAKTSKTPAMQPSANRDSAANNHHHQSTPTTPGTASSASKPKRVSKTPIIIIPAAGTSLITMYNVRQLLQDLRFMSSEDLKAQGTRRENEVLLQRTKNGDITVPYRVIDNPSRLTMDEWDRVVAVFVQGPAWQFKGWQWGGNPTEIFARICAFHLKYDDTKLDANVAKWSVNVLSLSKNKRHLDRAILFKFWDSLDKHIIKNKPYLRF